MSLDGAGAAREVGARGITRAPKTGELIASRLRRLIVRGELRPGDRLPSEVELMERFGVSRPILREAFRILENESLLDVRRGSRGGARVTVPEISVASRYVGVLLQIQGTTLADVYEARLELEPPCARMLAERRTEQDLADLRERIDDLEQAVGARVDDPDPMWWLDLTYRFHELVLYRSGNRTLALQGALLHDIVSTHLTLAVSRGVREPGTVEAFRRLIRSYRKLVQLVEARDAEGAERHWRVHMEVAAKVLGVGHAATTVVDLFN